MRAGVGEHGVAKPITLTVRKYLQLLESRQGVVGAVHDICDARPS